MKYEEVENLYKNVAQYPYKLRAKIIDFHFFHEQFLTGYSGDVVEGIKKMNKMCEEIEKDLDFLSIAN